MSKTVVLAEKPSVGRDLARVLKCHKKGNGYLEGDQYIVTWALGHLVTLADPEGYGKEFQSWRLEDLPIIPEPLKLVVIKKTGKQFNAVKSQLTRKDVNQIVIATDAGREGELVARWIIEKANVRKPIKRLWISSVTDKAIKEGFQKRSGKEYENLYHSAVARAEADWIVGINATRALTTKFNAQLSCGRVQTPTLAMIAKREADIQAFTPVPYYGIRAAVDGMTLTWQDKKSKQTRTFNQDVTSRLLKNLEGKQAVVAELKKTAKKSFAPALYDLTELRRDAHKRFGFSAKETLSVLQKLYEQHKLVTYPRTDSRFLSSDIVPTLKDRLEGMEVKPYAQYVSQIKKRGIKSHKGYVNDAKVSDHHAIIPTEEPLVLSSLSDKERKLYDLIAKRFLAVLMPAFEYEETKVIAEIGGETFTAKGKTVQSQGWKAVYDMADEDDEQEDDRDQTLPALQKGDTLAVRTLTETSGQTKPPSRFNEGTLLSAMENPSAFMQGEEKGLVKTLGETGGLGTVATRADIIEKLFNSFLIEKKGQDIFITSKGKQLLQLVPEDLKSPALTAEWEQKLSAIAAGKLKSAVFIKDMKAYAHQTVKEIKNSSQTFRHDNITGTACPECGKMMLKVNGKRGTMLVCQDRECGSRKTIARKTNARCPNCHKRMELRGQGEGQTFACVCGHREKLSVFEKRKNKDKARATKRDVSSYMKKQNKDEPINNALAEQLKKLGLDK
ncbi:DNA topoisomerase III [Bacillus subtilis]